MTEQTTETTEAPTVTRDDLDGIGQAFLDLMIAQAAEYNARAAALSAATGDKDKAAHEIRESSDDPKVVKFRKFSEDLMARHEAAVAEIHKYIVENLVAKSQLTPEQQEAEKAALKELRDSYNVNVKAFTGLPSVAKIAGAETLVPEIKGARRSVSSGGGSGTSKPRVSSITVDGDLMAHDVVKDGETLQKSTFTDAVKFLSEKHGVKIQTSDLHAGYFAAGGPDSATPVEYVFSVTDKAGKNHNHNVVVVNNKS